MNFVVKALLTAVISTCIVVLINRFVLGNVNTIQTVKTAIIFAVVFFVVSLFLRRR